MNTRDWKQVDSETWLEEDVLWHAVKKRILWVGQGRMTQKMTSGVGHALPYAMMYGM